MTIVRLIAIVLNRRQPPGDGVVGRGQVAGQGAQQAEAARQHHVAVGHRPVGAAPGQAAQHAPARPGRPPAAGAAPGARPDQRAVALRAKTSSLVIVPSASRVKKSRQLRRRQLAGVMLEQADRPAPSAR